MRTMSILDREMQSPARAIEAVAHLITVKKLRNFIGRIAHAASPSTR